MSLVNFTILDIGHGNSTIIHSSEEVALIDAANGCSIQDVLNEKKITKIDYIIISHADSDHIGGAVALLLDKTLSIKEVHLNPDPVRNSVIWGDFLTALVDARNRNGTKVITAINKDTESLSFNNFKLEVLSPSPIDCLTGPGSISTTGKKLDANTMSVVLKLVHENENIALISGDMDSNSLDYLKNNVDSLKAKILIFPHHGGLPKGGDPVAFAQELCDLVSPELIIFSNSRNKHNNPRKEIIRGISQSSCKSHLACTQMSKECCESEESLSSMHLKSGYPSQGQAKNHSCAGSINFVLNGANTNTVDVLANHKNYILNFENRKCKY